jgi:hypothetical protein
VLASLGNGYAVTGRTADALKVLTELEQMAKQRYVSPYNNARAFTSFSAKKMRPLTGWKRRRGAQRLPDLLKG